MQNLRRQASTLVCERCSTLTASTTWRANTLSVAREKEKLLLGASLLSTSWMWAIGDSFPSVLPTIMLVT